MMWIMIRDIIDSDRGNPVRAILFFILWGLISLFAGVFYLVAWPYVKMSYLAYRIERSITRNWLELSAREVIDDFKNEIKSMHTNNENETRA